VQDACCESLQKGKDLTSAKANDETSAEALPEGNNRNAEPSLQSAAPPQRLEKYPTIMLHPFRILS
jgi:hypothetical protein